SWPDRLDPVTPPCDWTAPTSWTFAPLDDAAFPAGGLSRAAVAAGATHPAVYNAANEEAVAAFLSRRAGVGDVVTPVERVPGADAGAGAGCRGDARRDRRSARPWAGRGRDGPGGGRLAWVVGLAGCGVGLVVWRGLNECGRRVAAKRAGGRVSR